MNTVKFITISGVAIPRCFLSSEVTFRIILLLVEAKTEKELKFLVELVTLIAES